MKTKITFNTGRKYTAEGQVITAEYDEEQGVIHFNDHSRMVTGAVQSPTSPKSIYDLARRVMEAYDVHEYRYSPESNLLRRCEAVLPY